MQLRTVLATWVPVEFGERLNSLARERHTSVSALVREALTTFVYGKPVPLTLETRGNQDGRESEALAIIRKWPEDSCRKLRDRLEDAGIKRGHDWVWQKRHQLRREAGAE